MIDKREVDLLDGFHFRQEVADNHTVTWTLMTQFGRPLLMEQGDVPITDLYDLMEAGGQMALAWKEMRRDGVASYMAQAKEVQ